MYELIQRAGATPFTITVRLQFLKKEKSLKSTNFPSNVIIIVCEELRNL
jgi:hypothetical protein